MTPMRLSPAELRAWAAFETVLPYSYYPDVSTGSCLAYRAAQLERMAANPTHHSLLYSGAGGEAAVGLTRLAWDSEQFNVPAGRVDYLILKPAADGRPRSPRDALALASAAAGMAVAAADELGIQHLSARLDARELVAIQAMERQGFEFVDAILKFALKMTGFVLPALPPGVVVRDAAEADIPVLAALAEQGFIYDRFHNDPLLPAGVADRVHRVWLTNAIQGRTADGVVMAEVDGRPAGFMIVALDRGTEAFFGYPMGVQILATVDRNVRRRGVGLALFLGSANWLRDRGAPSVEGGTQIANMPSSGVYLRGGFSLVGASVSLRRMGE